jgi:tetratricopeptide (TPR) repeat protein
VEERPDLYDAQMGFGLFRYLVAKAPRSFRWMLKLLGIDPDLEGGLKMLQTAAERGTYTRNEARLYLAQFLFTEDRHEEAFEHLNQLCREYPENTLFLVLRASWKQRLGRSDEALADAMSAIDYNNRHPLRYVEEIAYGTAGSILYARNDFQAARRYYEPYVDSLRNAERIRNWTWYRIGVTFELTGDRQRALSIYHRLREGSDDLRPSESIYYRRSRRLLTHPLSNADTEIIKAENAFNSKAYAEALTLYTTAVSAANDDVDARARGLYGMMQAQYELEQDAELEQTSQQLFSLKPDLELWVLPYGYFKLGQAFSRSGKRREAEQAFRMIESYDDYDFQDRLESRLDEEVEKLKALKEH